MGSNGTPAGGLDLAATPITTSPQQILANPVLDADFPDPHISSLDDGTFLAVGTNSGGRKLQLATSEDLSTWSTPTDASTQYPSWAHPEDPDLWAPVHVQAETAHLLLFSLRGARSGRHCIGAARSEVQAGPYRPVEEPIVCMAQDGGSIDPSVAVDESGAHLLWKTDGNCCGLPTILWSQPIDLSTLTLQGSPSELLRNELEWEQGVVEAPEMTEVDGQLFLTYCAGRYVDESYAVGAAVCDGPGGPCTRMQSFPMLSTTTDVVGPGGQTIVSTDDGYWLAYHAWDPSAVGYESGGRRTLRMDPLVRHGSRLIVLGPTVGQRVSGPEQPSG